LQATIAATLIRTFSIYSGFGYYFLSAVVAINLILMVFNLIPIPPLDGSRFFAFFFPILDDPRFETYGPILLLIFIFFLGGIKYLLPIVNFIATNVFRLGGIF
jgi:Zn-dependent protease